MRPFTGKAGHVSRFCVEIHFGFRDNFISIGEIVSATNVNFYTNHRIEARLAYKGSPLSYLQLRALKYGDMLLHKGVHNSEIGHFVYYINICAFKD